MHRSSAAFVCVERRCRISAFTKCCVTYPSQGIWTKPQLVMLDEPTILEVETVLWTQNVVTLLAKVSGEWEAITLESALNSFCPCDRSCDCIFWPSVQVCFSCCTDTNDCHLPHHFSLKNGSERGIQSYTSVYAPCQFLRLSRVSIVVSGGVETGVKVGTDFHRMAEQPNGRLLSATFHSSLGLERTCMSLEKNQACSGKILL